jgi:hypothetical protein
MVVDLMGVNLIQFIKQFLYDYLYDNGKELNMLYVSLKLIDELIVKDQFIIYLIIDLRRE